MEIVLLIISVAATQARVHEEVLETTEESTTLRELLDTMDQMQTRLRSMEANEYSYKQQLSEVQARLTTIERGNQMRTRPSEYQFNSVGCMQDVITLSCPANSFINVTDALYGQYAVSCSSCCFTEPQDCTETVADNDLGNWLSLKYQCDNLTTCSYQYTGEVINDCETGYVADYMQIFYDCIGGIQETVDPVGFTAYAASDGDYNVGETILFNQIVTDLGGHYEASTGEFTCPYSGVYMFSINVLSQEGERTYGALYRDDEYLVNTLGDDIGGSLNHFSQGSTFAVIECNMGQVVSVRAPGTSNLYGGPYSSFSGYLLHQFP